MREIKFRAKKIESNEWFYGGGIEIFGEKGLMISNMISEDQEKRPIIHEINPKTIGEFTGLHDKNGKKIWEGSIFKWPLYSGFEFHIGEVRWNKGHWDIHDDKDPATEMLEEWNEYGEVIGDIYSNPELLEGR